MFTIYIKYITLFFILSWLKIFDSNINNIFILLKIVYLSNFVQKTTETNFKLNSIKMFIKNTIFTLLANNNSDNTSCLSLVTFSKVSRYYKKELFDEEDSLLQISLNSRFGPHYYVMRLHFFSRSENKLRFPHYFAHRKRRT